MLAGAFAMGVAAFYDPALIANPYYDKIMGELAVGGIAMEAGAIADALTNNRGVNITTRQAAANRPIIYGVQRVGGVIVYLSTTGSHHNQYNYVIVLAGHVTTGIIGLYLDGRLVYFDTTSGGNSTRNGYNFGGSANGNSYGGPDGVQYNFGGLVYCEARYGDQLPGDIITGLTANDGNWAATDAGTPYLGGCTYVYLKIEYNTTVFPSRPEIRFTVAGKPVYDPRTDETGFSMNSALIAADWAGDKVYGLGLAVNQDQLIAAANVCDEAVTLAAGGSEARYCCHYHFDTATAPSDAFANMLKSMGGRSSFVGGELYIVPAYWQGPSFSFGEGSLTAPMRWDPAHSFKDNCNRVTGTYTAPNYPYNVGGDAYDANGFRLGEIQNNFQFGFQPTNFPQYQADQLHGFAADEYLNEDSGVTASWTSGATFAAGDVVSYTQVIAGVPFASVWASLADGNTGNTPGPTSTHWVDAGIALPLEVSYNMVLSIVQAQRLAKIEMLRNRSWGGGTFEMGLAAFAMQDFDVMNFSFPLHGWTNKVLEITNVTFRVVTEDAQPGELPPPPECRVSFDVHETAESIYEWDPTEEQTIYDLPALPQQQYRQPAPPTSFSLNSNAATALVQPDGTIVPRIELLWDTPLDGFVTQIRMRYRVTGTTPWTDAGMVDVALNFAFISPVIAGQTYDVAIQSVRPSGATSAWVEIDSFGAGYLVSSGSAGYGPGSLIGQAYTDGTAGIECQSFTALIGSRSLSIFPSGEVQITGLVQQRLYYVYWIDPTVAGGDVTPIATLLQSDFINKVGYFLIGSVVTPYAALGGSSGLLYRPSTYQDIGTRTTSSPDASYDGDSTTAAVVSGLSIYVRPFTLGDPPTWASTSGDYIMQGEPAVVLSADATLTIDASVAMSYRFATGGSPSPPFGSASIIANINGSLTTMLSVTSTTARTLYTATVPAGTPLNAVTVEVAAVPNDPPGPGGNHISVSIFDNYIRS